MTRVKHSDFDPTKNFNRGRSRVVFAIWYLVKVFFFLSSLPWPMALKSMLLRIFGAKIGRGVYWKPRINIHFPWKLVVGDHALFGEEVMIINFEKVEVGSQACISQRATLCAGNHDYRDVRMSYRNAPIHIGPGAWIGACAFIAPGVTVGQEAVVTACSAVFRDMPDGMVCSGNPCVPIKPRWSSAAPNS
jgi:putative colanic acid biosynthesis acetyltransferase WcaF